MTRSKKIMILGFGGHARSVADIALANGYDEIVFIEESAKVGENFLGHRVTVSCQDFVDSSWHAFPAAGDGLKRKAQCELIDKFGAQLVTLISPTATVRIGAKIETGTLVAHHAHIGPMVKIGRACIVNTGAVIDHEVVIGDYSHISINSTIAGRCQIGGLVMIGAGATVIDRINIADEVMVGAGAVVVENIEIPGCYVGIPAKRMGLLSRIS